LLSLSSLSSAAGPSHVETAAIEQAVRAPLGAFMNRQVAPLCASFTPQVAAQLSPGGSNCDAVVAHAFHALQFTAESYPRNQTPARLRIVVVQHGNVADATTAWPWQGPAHVHLVKVGARWLIATKTTLVEEVTCRNFLGERACSTGFAIVFGSTPSRVVRHEAARHVIEERREGGMVVGQFGASV